jgi:hypothetical protein
MLIAQFKDLNKQLTTNLRFLAMRSKIYYEKRRFEEIDQDEKKSVFAKKESTNHEKKQ